MIILKCKVDIQFWYGQKERYIIKGMKTLKNKLPNMKLIYLGIYGHGEVMFTKKDIYLNLVKNALKQ